MTMCKVLVAVVVLGLLGAVKAQGDLPDTVDAISVELYLGRWYQMYANILVNQTFERDAYCVTADYGPINETYVSVYNANNQGAPDGEINDISGYAFIPDLTEPGQLYVFLDGGNPNGGEYWVLLLGPETFGEDGLYQYSIVSTSTRGSLFVLARDPAIFREDYEAEVLEFLANNGFDTPITEPLETYQAPDCQYTPLP